MNQLAQGKRDEINQILEQLQGSLGEELKRHIHYYFPQQGDDFVEELIQQTWIKVWTKAGQCLGETRPFILSWIKKIAHTTGLNLLRDSQKLDLFIDLQRQEEDNYDPDHESDPLDGAESLWEHPQDQQRPIEESVIFRDTLQASIKKLNPREHRVFVLNLYGYSKSEIATMMNISKPRVTQYLDQIRKKCMGVETC